MSLRLAQFDSLLSRRRQARAIAPATPTAHTWRDPWGEPVAVFSRAPTDAQLLAAAHRVQAGDVLLPLADDALTRGAATVWRLAMLRADRHGQARSGGDSLQWISAPLRTRAGARADELRAALQAQGVEQLRAAGWRLTR